jgi:hypothetical protein
MGSVSENSRRIYSSEGHYITRPGHLRHHVPAADGPYEPRIANRVSGDHANTRSNWSSTIVRSWQARNPWYSGIAIAASIGALVVMLFIETIK